MTASLTRILPSASRCVRSALLASLTVMASAPLAAASSPAFQDPPVFQSEHGSLSVLMIAAKRPNVAIGSLRTDLWTYEVCRLAQPGANACPPGTGQAGLGGVRLALQPGDTLRVRLVNKLPPLAPGDADHIADHATLAGNPTNLHTHGLIVEPHRAVGPADTYGDYVFLELRNPVNPIPPAPPHPGVDVATGAVEYLYKIEATHPTGLFWFHPHLHGLSLNQVSAGMSGIITIGSPEDTCNDRACASAIQQASVRHLVLKDTQILQGGKLKTQEEPNFCSGAPGAGRQGSCPGQFIDPTDPTSDYRGGTWMHTVSGQVYPTIDVGAAGDVWRVVNASGSRSYSLSLVDAASNTPIKLQVLAIDGVTLSASTGSSAAETTARLARKANVVPCPGTADAGSHRAVCATVINMMPSSRVELRVVRSDGGANTQSAILRTLQYNTGDDGGGDQWPAVDLAAVRLAPRNPAVSDLVTMRDLTASMLSSSGHLLARSTVQVPGTDTLVPSLGADARVTAAPPGPAIQSMQMAPTVAITPDQAVGRAASTNCAPLAAGHRRKILFGYPQPTTFGLGYVETDAMGNDIEATRIPIGEFNPAQTIVCVPLPGGQAVHELWELQNLTDEDHNFHIHQTRFFLVAGGVAPGVTIPTLLDGSLVLHDNVPVPHPAVSLPCADGTLAAVKAGTCKPSSTFVVIPFREIGDFVFHCHILEHEDGGMMARIRVVSAAQN